MRTALLKTTRLLALAAALIGALPAQAALLDKGPPDPTLIFPQWYRDLDGTAVGLCKSQVPSPNSVAGLGPMCFPLAADPAGFAGNVGGEIFYNNLNVLISKGAAAGGTSTFALRYVAALEAAYIPGPAPAHGQEAVFARIRVVANVVTPGTYTVTHPFGVEVFPDVPAAGPRSIFYTVDIPVGVPGDFTGALSGRIGPFIQWDVLNPDPASPTGFEQLSVGGQQFLGDPNYEHTYTGSPFGTNFVRVDGPPGSNLDGAGNDFIVQPMGNVLGQRWTAPIATAFNVQKAVYSRGATLNTVDVWATSAVGQRLVATGTDLPTIQLAEFAGGNYYGHVEYSNAFIPPPAITVTNLSSNPVNQVTAQVVDQLDALAAFDPASRALAISATSSDLSGPSLVVLAPFGGPMIATTPGNYTYSGTIPAGTQPPMQVRVESNAGGVYLANVVVGSGNPMNAPGLPVAADDLDILVAGSGSTTIPVSANDTFAGVPTALVLTQPLTGSAVASGGSIIYTPGPGASGADAFTYALQDAVGISNVATVTFVVPFVAPAPTAAADNMALQVGTTRVANVLANDVAGVGTVIDPLSVQVVGAGASVDPATGAVSYTAGGATGTFTFSYSVANTAGTRSAPATVTMVVFGGPESVSFSKAQFTVSNARWTITGSTNWFNATLTQATASCWTGTAAQPTATTLIGTAPIDTTGKFQLVPTGPTPTPANPSSVTCRSSYGGTKSTGVVFK
jgi:Big-like domain-containing protein